MVGNPHGVRNNRNRKTQHIIQTECQCLTNGVPVLYAETRESGSDEVAGLQREKQASNPILRSFHE